ncbi:myosin-6 [Ixodes scapularis]
MSGPLSRQSWQTQQTRQKTDPAWTFGRLQSVTMVAREKREALIEWMGCYDVEIKALSDLRSGSLLLTLISTIDPALSPENVDPSEAFSKLEGFLSSFHGCLPAHFLSRAAHRGDASQLELATASVLALAALFFKAASLSGTMEVAPIMRLAQGVQERIKEMLQIVAGAEDDVLTNLQAHLQASPDAESPESVRVKTKRKSSCFSYSPSPVRLPLKRVVDSPSRRSGPSAERAKEMKVLRRQLEEELQRAADLDKEIASRDNTIARKDQEIKVLQQRVICLDSNLSDATSEGAALKQDISSLRQRNSFLEEQVRAMDTLKEAYDQVIRENSTLKQQSNDRADSEATILALQANVASALSTKDALEARLSEVEQQRHGFASQLAEKERELASLVEYYASRERRMPASPGTPPTPNTPVASCYVEMRVVELEEANQGLEGDRDRLKAELDSLTTRFNAEANRLQSSLAESEQALRLAEEFGRSLRGEVSSLGAKLRVSEEQTRALQEANADLQTLVTTGGEQLRDVQSRLEDLSQQHAAAEREAVASRKANEALRLHNESLQSSLATSEGGRTAAVQTVLALQEQLRQVLAAREEDASSLHELRQHCEALSSRNEAGEASLKSTCAQLADAQARCDRLDNENRALNDRIRDFEVRMTDLLRLKEQAEDRYRSCFQEKEENERHLKEQVQTLSSEALDSASLVKGLQAEVSRLSQEVDRLLREVERLTAEVEDARKTASDSLVQERELREHLRVNGDHCEVLLAQCKLLDEQKEQLGVELKTRMDSLEAEAHQLKVSLAESEQAACSLDKLCSSYRDEIASLKKELQTSAEQRTFLLKANAELETFALTETHKLHDMQCELESVSQQHVAIDREACSLRKAVETLELQNQSLQSSLETLEASSIEAMLTIRTLREELQQARSAQEEDSSLLQKLQQDCETLRSQNEAGNASLNSTCTQLAEARLRCDNLENQNRQLEERIADLEARIEDLLHLKEQAEEDYQKGIEETEKGKDVLQAQVDALSLEARDSADSAERARAEVARLCEENGRLALRVERLGADVEGVSKRASEDLERMKRELQERSEQYGARCEAATARCRLLEKEKEALRADLTAKLDSLTAQFNAEASRLRTSLTESEQAVLSMKELQVRSQDEASSLRRKLRTSEEERDALHKANADLRAFATTGSQQLQDMRLQLDAVSQQRDSIGQEVHSLQKAGEALQLQNQLLRSSLETSEAGKAAAEASCMEATRSIHTLREKLQKALSARKDTESSLQMVQRECLDLRTQNESGGASLKSSQAELAEALARCSRLDDENQALRDLVGDLEVQLKNLEHLKKRAEDDYYKCVEEKERHKDSLKERIEALASEARDSASTVRESQSEASKLREENGRLVLEVERLKTEAEEAAKRAGDDSERREKELLQESRLHVARCEAATARCELLEKENERLEADLKTAKESYGRKLQAAFSEMTTESNKRISAFKKREVTLREEIEALKKKCEDEKASHEKRERLFHKHVNEMESRVTQTNEDIETLKAQLSENDGKLATATSERDRLAMENRSLKAQLNYCELKMKEQRVKGSANSLSASNESLWSQKTSSGSLASLRSNSSLVSDQFKVPLHRPSSRRDSTLRASSTSFAQPAALDTTIFSESRYSCDEEQDMFTHTNLTDLSRRLEEDPMGRYSELYRRNSMLQPHLKSSYPVETQTSKIPATPLKGTSSHVFSFAEASTSKQDEASKRKRSARSDSSGSGGATSGATSDVVTASTPRASKSGTSRTGRVTPSSVKKFIKKTFTKS